LRRDAELRGKVEVRFVIERDGNASNLMDGGSTLPDTSVVRCIINSVGVLAFPKPRGPWLAPDGGTMSVKLEIWLTPG
jgi:Ca-activated chloride channel family protein